MTESNKDIKNLLKSFEGKECFILTKFNIRYKAHKINVQENSIKFIDKFDTEVYLALDQIAQVTEVSSYG